MSLSQPTISAIVSALLHEREDLKDDLVFWSLHASHVAKTHCQQIAQSLQDNAAALTELANGMAPWLKQHPQYGFITQLKDTA